MYKIHKQCRACGNENLVPVFDLGVQPLANSHRKPGESCAGWAPLKVLFCERCTLAQLSVVVDPSVLYSNYSYTTPESESTTAHFHSLCKTLLFESGVKKPTLLEIGSNDGKFLHFAARNGFGNIVGIDPAINLGKSQEYYTVQGTFNATTAALAGATYNPIHVVLARHVFCHVDDWRDFIRCLEYVTHKDTVVAIEVPYCGAMLEHCQFDSIYHEHTSYMTVKAMSTLLMGSGFRIHKIIPYEVHGGSVCFIIKQGEQEDLNYDKDINIEAWGEFSQSCGAIIGLVKKAVIDFGGNGRLVCGFGAPAKATVLINAMGIGHEEISFVTDNTPEKIGRLIPGTAIPIIDEAEFWDRNPDAAIMFCWNYRTEILNRYKSWTGKFIIPFPSITVI